MGCAGSKAQLHQIHGSDSVSVSSNVTDNWNDKLSSPNARAPQASRRRVDSLWKLPVPSDPNAVLYPPDESILKPLQCIEKNYCKEIGVMIAMNSRMGSRPEQQDFATIYIHSDPPCAACAVFDGHGSDEVSKDLQMNFTHRVVDQIIQCKPEQVQDEIRELFLEYDKLLCNQDISLNAGSCAILAIVLGDALIIVNTGDSEAYLCKKGKAYELSQPHRASNPNEIARIHRCGGEVVNFGGLRVAAVLAVSRTFGDAGIKHGPGGAGLTADPHICVIKLDGTEEFVVLGSDGLFDVFPNKQNLINTTKSKIKTTKNLEDAAEALVDMAVDDRHSTDNTTVCIIGLNQTKKSENPVSLTRTPIASLIGVTNLEPLIASHDKQKTSAHAQALAMAQARQPSSAALTIEDIDIHARFSTGSSVTTATSSRSRILQVNGVS